MAPSSRRLLVCLLATLMTLHVATAADFNLVILHTSVMISRFEQTNLQGGTCSKENAADNKCYGGFARIAHKVKELKRLAKENQGPPAIFVTTGDTYVGTAWFFVHKWKIVTNLTNMLSIDAATIGNHEFDLGVEGLVPFLNGVTYPVVVSNMDMSQEPSMQATPLVKSTVLTVAGKKIGIVGYLTTETKVLSATGKVVFLDELESVRKEAAALKNQGVDIIIALGHAGYVMDLKIASEVPDVDVVVGGHSETFLYTGNPPDPTELVTDNYPKVVVQSSGKQVPLVHAFIKTKYLGNLSLTFNTQGEAITWQGNPILLDHKIKEDPAVLQVLDVWREKTNEKAKKLVGITRVHLNTTCVIGECNMGNFAADIMLQYHYKTSQATGDDKNKSFLVLQNSGNFRLPHIDATRITNGTKGIVLMEDLYRVVPYDNTIMLVNMTGQHILEALEWGVNSYPIDIGMIAKGAFLQVSGLRVNFDMCKKPGERVTSVQVPCTNCRLLTYIPLDPVETYGVVMTKYLYNGGDKFKIKETSEVVKIFKTSFHDMVVEYFNKTSPVYPGLEGRITIAPIYCRRKNRGVRRNTSDVTLLQCLAFVLLAVADVFFFV